MNSTNAEPATATTLGLSVLQHADPLGAAENTPFVLAGRPLGTGFSLEQTSRFDDEVWRLEPAQLQAHRHALCLTFSTVPAAHRPVAKHLCFGLLSGPLPPGERRQSISTICSDLTDFRRLFTWLEARTPGAALPRLTGQDLLAYQRHLLTELPSKASRVGARTAIRKLWHWRHTLAPVGGGLAFDPQHLRGWHEPRSSSRRTENTTRRIPEPVLGPLITWALRFVDDFAPDILATEQRRRQLRADPRETTALDTAVTGATVSDRLQSVLTDHRERQQPLPGRHGQLNLKFLAQLVGCDRRTTGDYASILHAAVDELGVAAFCTYGVPVTARLHGRPWIDALVSDHLAHHGLTRLTRLLQSACYILIAFLSGMRDSEIKHLRRGCLHGERAATGTVRRWTVTSRAFKGEHDPAGVEATWVIGAPAARAVQVLEQLQPDNVEWLFAVLPNTPGCGPAGRSSSSTLSTDSTVAQINAFSTWVNQHTASYEPTEEIPPVDGRPWHLTSRQFRRTLAWFIPRQPGGVIAGAIAYRHHAIQMFEGYAGTSDSGFRAEVESEQALARGEHLVDLIERHEHTALTGPAANEAARRLTDLDANMHFSGTVITDPRRLKRLLDQADPNIHPGDYVTCVFDPDKALCTGGTRASAPVLRHCRPLECRNVALHQHNLNTWRGELDDIQRHLATRPTLPPLLADRLRRRHEQITVFLTRNAPEQGESS